MRGTLGGVARDRDVAAFNERATGYDAGRLGRWHQDIADRAADVAASHVPQPSRILDVGSGTGYLLQHLADRLPAAVTLSGVDPAPNMAHAALLAAADPRMSFTIGAAEHLPFDAARFDLVISTTSFDHWSDQRAGLAECVRVLKPNGYLILCDQFSQLLIPTLIGDRRDKARTQRRAEAMLKAAGLSQPSWHGPFSLLIRVAAASKPNS